jgi:hypothetical protein
VDPVAPVAAEPAAPPPLDVDSPSVPAGEAVQLVQIAGQIWSVPDLASLQRWILEARLDRNALVSRQGLRWARVGDREDLAVFFAAADALASRERPAGERVHFPAPMDDEIIVDGAEGDGDDYPSMPVATGPGPEPTATERGTVVMDFAEPSPRWPALPRDDTQEQTVGSSGLDETPIPGVSAALDTPDRNERTERMRVPSQAPPPPPSQPDARFGLTGAAVAAPPPGPPIAPHGAPRPLGGVPPVAPAVRSPVVTAPPAGPVPPTLVPVNPNASPSASQAFYLENGPSPSSGGGPKVRDVFDDPPTGATAGGGRPWMLYAGIAAVAAVALYAVVAGLGGSGDKAGPVAKGGAQVNAAGAPASPEGAPGVPSAGAGAGSVPVGADGAAGAVAGEGGDKAAADKAAAQKAAFDEAMANKAAAKAAAAEAAADKAAADKAAAEKAAAEKAARAVARAEQPATTRAAPQEAPARSGGSPAKLIEQGWKAVDAGDMTKAHGLFSRALQGGGSSNALYGRGYANEKLGDTVSAGDDYCNALRGGAVSTDIQREIEGGLRRLGKSCP